GRRRAGKTGRDYVLAPGQALLRARAICSARLLEHGDSVYLRRTSERAKAGLAIGGQGTSALYQRRAAELECIPAARRDGRVCAELLSHVFQAGFAGERWRLSLFNKAGGADPDSYAEDAMQAGTTGSRSASHGAN